MNLIVTRREQDSRATRSTFGAGDWQGFMLERAGAAFEPGAPVRIPAGIYGLELKPVGTSRFDDTAIQIMAKHGHGRHMGMIRLVDVPGRSEILIHWGNYYSDSTGCLLVGASRFLGPRRFLAVGGSRDAYARFYDGFAPVVERGGAMIDIREQFGEAA